jgi:polyisoprenyl-teichoic acid--peptidoglycan teichoic acid transferase
MIDFKKKMKNDQDFINEDFINEKNKRNKKIRFFTIIIITTIVIFSGKVIMSSPQTSQWIVDNTFWGKIKHLTESSERKLFGQDEDLINILLLGIGGSGHDGGQLTDTIMLASLKPSTKEVALTSIPRDLAVPNDFSSKWRKINSINALTEFKNPKEGGEGTVKVVSNILDTPIKYYLRLDFKGFIKIIDELGGIEVEVENTLEDPFYPIEGEEDNPDYYARFQHLYIEKGLQKMDGSLALKYVRSRYATGIEGSDFARGRRQQKVLEAVKDKLISLDTLLKPAMLSRIISQLDNSITTNLSIWEMFKLWEDYKDIDNKNIINFVFDDSPQGMLVASRGDEGAFILLPRDGNFSQMQNYINNIFEKEKKTDKIEEEQEEEVFNEKEDLANLTIINGTWITGLAANTADNLQRAGFYISKTVNAPERNWENTYIYDLSYGREKEILNKIINLTQAELAYDAPVWLEEYRQENIDFIIILGSNN